MNIIFIKNIIKTFIDEFNAFNYLFINNLFIYFLYILQILIYLFKFLFLHTNFIRKITCKNEEYYISDLSKIQLNLTIVF